MTYFIWTEHSDITELFGAEVHSGAANGPAAGFAGLIIAAFKI